MRFREILPLMTADRSGDLFRSPRKHAVSGHTTGDQSHHRHPLSDPGVGPVDIMEGANVLQTVFDTIMYVIEVIKNFLKELGINVDKTEDAE